MAESNDIKRRLLSGVVQDNLGLVTPTEPLRDHRVMAPPQPPRQRRWEKKWGVVFFIILTTYLSVHETSTIPQYPEPLEHLPVLATSEPVPPPMLPEPPLLSTIETRPAAVEMEPSIPHEEPASTSPTVFPAPQRLDLTVLPLTAKKIVLDPGHGGKDSGARTPAGLLEKELTLDIALRLRTLLEHDEFVVFLTRDKDDTVPLMQRTAFANAQGADLFVSIHINSMELRQIRGIETYYLGPTNDPVVLQLAAQENQESGYSLADFRRLLESIHLHVKREESRRFAEATQQALFTSLQAINPTLSNRGVKTAPFAVLTTTEMPALLAEVACMSHEEEARLLATPQYRQEIAQALARGIRAYTDALHRSARKGTP